MSEFSEKEATKSERETPLQANLSAVQLAWRALTAPTSGAILALSLAFVWGTVLVIPQGASDAALLANFSYAEAQAIRSLGLQNVVTSWPSLALMVLLILHVVGLVLWARESGPGFRSSGSGGWSAQSTLELNAPLEEVTSALSRGDHGNYYGGADASSAASRPRFWRGLWREGLILITLGVIVALVSIPVDLVWGLEARMTLATQPGEVVSTPVSTEVRDFRGWVQGESPVLLSCQDPDPADALRRRSCEARSHAGVFPVTLRAGKTSKVAGVELTPSTERPRRTARRTSLLLEAPGEGPRVLRGDPGRTYELAGGSRLTTFEGPDGPLVVARASASERPVLMGPGGQGQALHAGHTVSGVSGWIFDVDVESKPGQPLRLAGGLLLIIGLLLMSMMPHAEIILESSPAGVRVVINSHNRASLPGEISDALSNPQEAT